MQTFTSKQPYILTQSQALFHAHQSPVAVIMTATTFIALILEDTPQKAPY